MNIAQTLLHDLAGIGATIEIIEGHLLLRAGSTAIPGALVRRIRESKRDVITALSARKRDAASQTCQAHEYEGKQPTQTSGSRFYQHRTPESLITRWLDEHPAPSQPGRCAWCGRPELAGAVVVPFGTEPGTHTWLHSECWSPWHRARTVEAANALGLTSDFGPTPGGL
jgi:hypothetical protein